ncbi:hypothetical protein AI2680V1_0845 [Citrobacter freundii]|nr:hypothetical protein AI2680V1_0845 [Citrobacter freundii]
MQLHDLRDITQYLRIDRKKRGQYLTQKNACNECNKKSKNFNEKNYCKSASTPCF